MRPVSARGSPFLADRSLPGRVLRRGSSVSGRRDDRGTLARAGLAFRRGRSEDACSSTDPVTRGRLLLPGPCGPFGRDGRHAGRVRVVASRRGGFGGADARERRSLPPVHARQVREDPSCPLARIRRPAFRPGDPSLVAGATRVGAFVSRTLRSVTPSPVPRPGFRRRPVPRPRPCPSGGAEATALLRRASGVRGRDPRTPQGHGVSDYHRPGSGTPGGASKADRCRHRPNDSEA